MTFVLSPEQQRNVETVRRLYDCERRQDLSEWVKLWHRDGRQTFPWTSDAQEVRGITDLEETARHKFATRTGVVIEDEVHAMADPRQVFATAFVAMTMIDFGLSFSGRLWCRFFFDEQGLILEHQEVFDSAAASDV